MAELDGTILPLKNIKKCKMKMQHVVLQIIVIIITHVGQQGSPPCLKPLAKRSSQPVLLVSFCDDAKLSFPRSPNILCLQAPL
jgi:hypothetical protein